MTEFLSLDGRVVLRTPTSAHLRMGGCNPAGERIGVNSQYLTKGGEPWLPVMGEFHFSRYPRAYWEEALLSMKACGVSVIASYIFWIHHEEVEGVWNWEGNRSLQDLAELCARHDLALFPRIGPWAHGECRNGGFPDWLLARCPVVRADHACYLGYVEAFYRQIYAQLEGYLYKQGGPVIGIQIENEYGHVGGGGHPEHIITLKRMAQSVGFDVPLYTVTGWGGAWVPMGEVLPLLGGYPAAPWTQHTRQLAPPETHLFQSYANDASIGSDLAVSALRDSNYSSDLYPYMTCETGGGIQVTDHRRPLLAPEDVAATPYTQIGSGVNMLGYYVFHGGTNPVGQLSTFQESKATGYPNDLPALSYDFQAAVREYGQLHGSYRHLKLLHLFLNDFGEMLAPMAPVFPTNLPSGSEDAKTLRYTVRLKDDRGFLFVNNHQRYVAMADHDEVSLRVALDSGDVEFPAFRVQPDVFFVWPFNLDLGGAWLVLAEAQPVCRVMDDDIETVVFAATPGVSPVYSFDATTIADWHVTKGHAVVEDDVLVVSALKAGVDSVIQLTTAAGRVLRILTLTAQQALNLWKGEVGGHETLVLTSGAVQFDQGDLIVTDRSPNVTVELFPASKEAVSAATGCEATDHGIFRRVTMQQPAHPVSVRASVDPRTPFTWRLQLAEGTLDGINDVFLRFDLDCNKAQLYVDDGLAADHFYNGEIWEVGLKRFLTNLDRTMVLRLEPLQEGAEIYFDHIPRLNGGTAASLNSVEAVVEYRFKLTV